MKEQFKSRTNLRKVKKLQEKLKRKINRKHQRMRNKGTVEEALRGYSDNYCLFILML